jgi:hypothetical protein
MNLVPKFLRKKTVMDKLSEGTVTYKRLPETLSLETDSFINAPKISLIYGIYINKSDFTPLYDMLSVYDSYDESIKNQMELILVDDGSPNPLTIPENTFNLNITLLRILEDKAWNSCGARNLGACYSQCSKLVFSDLDFVVEEKTLESLIYGKINPDEMIVFHRQVLTENGYARAKHALCVPNIFAILKSTFLNFNGYDEDIVGTYGDDIYFRKYITSHGMNFKRFGHIRETTPNANSIALEHSLSRDLTGVLEYLKTKQGHTKVMLNFPWEFVASFTFSPSAK